MRLEVFVDEPAGDQAEETQAVGLDSLEVFAFEGGEEFFGAVDDFFEEVAVADETHDI